MRKDFDDLPVFKSYSEFRYHEFKKRKTLLFAWSFIHWGALTIQNIFQLLLKLESNSPYLIEILLFIFYFVTWLAFGFLLKLGTRSFKWYTLYEYLMLVGTVMLSPLGFWYASSQKSAPDMFQYYVEVSLSIQCFFFLTQRGWQRIVCYIFYVIASMLMIVFYYRDFTPHEIVRKILFSIAVSCSFGMLNYAFEAGSRDMLNSLQEFWKSSLEIIPHGMVMLDNELMIKYANTAFGKIFDEPLGFKGRASNSLVEKLAHISVWIRNDNQLSSASLVAVNAAGTTNNISSTFNDFLKIELSQKSNQLTVSGDCKIAQKSVEVKALRTSFEGSKDYYFAIFVDHTQRDKLAQLEDQNGFKDNLLKSVSHELRGPLNASTVSIARVMESNLTAEDKNTLDIALSCQFRLLKSVDCILDLAKIKSKQIRIKVEEVNVAKVIKRIVGYFDYLMKQKNIRFELKTRNAYTSFFINSDNERIEQIFYQLIDNAVKFTPVNGLITLEADQVLTCNGSYDIKVSISDSGCGLSNEELERIKVLLSKGSTSRKISQNSVGAGLGLMITSALIKKIGYNCEVVSEPNNGTRISFTLKNMLSASFVRSHDPHIREESKFNTKRSLILRKDLVSELDRHEELKNDTTVPLNLTSTDTEIPDDLHQDIPRRILSSFFNKNNASKKMFQANKPSENIQNDPSHMIYNNLSNKIMTEDLENQQIPKILVVDDDPFNIFALKSRLTQIGYTVLTAFNGKEAIEITNSNHLDIFLILMDCNMPVMDGYEATKLLKEMMKKDEIAYIPIIACTAYAQDTEKSRCLELGFDDFVTKPLDSEKLNMIIKKFLRNCNEKSFIIS